jgi:hypothetical protein
MPSRPKILVVLTLSSVAAVAATFLEVRAGRLRRDMAELYGSGRFAAVSWSPDSDAEVIDEALGSPWQGRKVRRLTWTDRYSGVGYLVDIDPASGRLIAMQEIAIDDLWALLGNTLRVLAAIGVIASITLAVRVFRARRSRRKASPAA